MIVLHASWLKGALHLWGERRLSSKSTVAPRRRGRSRKGRTPAPSPYDVDANSLADAVATVPVSLSPVPSERAGTLCAWLPTVDGVPLPSSPLVAEAPLSDAPPALVPWSVTALELHWPVTRDLLGATMGRRLLAVGLVAGEDLRWWAEALRLAARLTVRGAFLPGLVEDESGTLARWRAVLDPADRRQQEALAASLPGAARCLAPAGADGPPSAFPADIVGRFVSWSVDGLVRDTSGDGTPTRRRRRRKPSFSSLHDAWMAALYAEDARVPWRDPQGTHEFVAQLESWRRPIAILAEAPVRLCFRLEEPVTGGKADSAIAPDADAQWCVRYVLQPHGDRSLLVDVADLWRPRSRPAAALHRAVGDVQEYLLAGLGQAAGLSPAVAESLEAPRCWGYQLSTEGAHRFLTIDAPALEAAGFGVFLPAWWTRSGTQQRLAVHAHVKSPTMQAKSGLTLDAVAEVNWQVVLGDTSLTFQELERLATMKVPLVRLRGTWVELDAQQLREAAILWAKRWEDRLSAAEAMRLAIGAGEAPGGLPVVAVTADGWVGDLLGRLGNHARLEPVPVAESFGGALRPYQERGLAWLAFLRRWGLGACLADDMGLGKTVQTLALLLGEREAGETRPVLVVCPTSVMANWAKEAARFTPELPVLVHHGAGRKKRGAFAKEARRHALVVSSYALLHRDLELLKAVSWAGVVLDEAQNVKNPETKQSRAARSLATDYRIALTGTPVENHVGDLWAVMEFLNPGLLGSQTAFRKRFFIPIQVQGDKQAAERLKGLTGPFILRRLKTDKTVIADLPEKQEMKTWCTLTREQATLYAAVLKDLDQRLEGSDGIERKGLVLATISKLKQVCNHPAHFLADGSVLEGRSGKLVRLVEMLEEVFEVGERALVFTQFAKMGALLRRHLEDVFGRETLFLHGGVPKKKRDRMVERFQDVDEAPGVFILSLKAGGTGLNLTAANHVFHFDRWWNPAVENQATDRAFRIGQARAVQVHKFTCTGTLEERIDAMIEQKTALSARVVGTGEAWLTELSNEQLRRVLALGKEAVGD